MSREIDKNEGRGDTAKRKILHSSISCPRKSTKITSLSKTKIFKKNIILLEMTYMYLRKGVLQLRIDEQLEI